MKNFLTWFKQYGFVSALPVLALSLFVFLFAYFEAPLQSIALFSIFALIALQNFINHYKQSKKIDKKNQK